MDGLIEPYLIKAISLLHSSAKDSGDQIKAMLDEAIRLKNESNSSSSASKLPPPLTMMKKVTRKIVLDKLTILHRTLFSRTRKRKMTFSMMKTFLSVNVEKNPHVLLSLHPQLQGVYLKHYNYLISNLHLICSIIEKNKESKRKHDMFNDEDTLLIKKFKDSPRSSQPCSPTGRYN